MAPKPSKPISIANICPMSLTSCAVKQFKRMVNERLTAHLQENDRYPHMFSFAQRLSTQDVLFQIKEDVRDNLSIHSKSFIPALEVKVAFDNVSHEAILNNQEDIDCGDKPYAYMSAFLTNHMATVGIANLRSKACHLHNSGMPQGLVVLPLLFNVVLLETYPAS